MATRLYMFVTDNPPTVSPAYSAGWDGTSGAAVRCTAKTVAGGTGVAAYTVAGSTTAGHDHLYVQHIYGPLAPQTISGTLKGQLMVREENIAVDARTQVRAYVVSADGGTVRGVLLELSTAALSSEFGTVYQNRKAPLAAISPAALTPVAAQAGDWLVTEHGFRQHGTNATGSRIAPQVNHASGTDAPEDETSASGSGNVWMEFSADLLLAPGPQAFGSIT